MKKEGVLQKVWHKGRRGWQVLAAHKFTTIAGTLVFFLIMSFVPLTFWLALLAGSTGINTDALLDLELFGWARELLAFFKNNAEGATVGVSVLFLATTLWSSTGFFYHLRRSGEIIYDYARNKQGWRVRLSAALLTFLVVLSLAVAGAVLVFVSMYTRFLPRLVSAPVLYSLLLVFGFFAAWILNIYVCPYRCNPMEVALGSFFTSLAWLFASAVFAVYLSFSNPEKLYGALSVFIVFLLWLYWLMICFTAGVIYNCRGLEKGQLEHKML